MAQVEKEIRMYEVLIAANTELFRCLRTKRAKENSAKLSDEKSPKPSTSAAAACGEPVVIEINRETETVNKLGER